MPFRSDLVTRWELGKDKAILDWPLAYYSPRMGKEYIAPIGFESNGESNPFDDNWDAPEREPAVIHDYLYWLVKQGKMKQGLADLIYRDMLIEMGATKIKAYSSYIALRLFAYRR